ncbi:M48 family metallopeptidase [Spirochaetota bacterium]
METKETENIEKDDNTELPREKIYNRIKIRISIISTVLDIAFIAIFAFSGVSPIIESYIGMTNPYLRFIAFIMILGLMVSLISTPIDFYSSYILEHRFGLSNQNLTKWLLERLKSTGISLIIGLPVALAFYYFLKVSGNLWWLYFSLFVLFISVILARLAPIIIFPLFYKFKELPDNEVKQKLTKLLESQCIKFKGIFTYNVSKDTKKANAGFTGIGKGKRIILSDTLMENFTPGEVSVVFAHEIGHYKFRHIIKGLTLNSIIILLSFFICGIIYESTLSSMGFKYIYEISAIPVLFFYLTIFGLIIMPLTNYISRKHEVQADSYAIDITGDKNSFISSMEKLSQLNLADKEPGAVTEFIFYSHPSIKKRIDFARGYKRNNPEL